MLPLSKTFDQALLPDFAEQFATDFGFTRRASAHQSLRRGHNADAQSADDGLDVLRTDIKASAWTRNPLDAGDDAAAVRRVLQKNAKRFVALVFVHHLECGDVTLFLEDAGNLALQTRRPNVHPLVLGGNRVADAGQKIGNGIGLHNSPDILLSGLTSWLSRRREFLP